MHHRVQGGIDQAAGFGLGLRREVIEEQMQAAAKSLACTLTQSFMGDAIGVGGLTIDDAEIEARACLPLRKQ